MSNDSRFLSLILRHKPEEVGLTLDPAGWVEIAALLAALKKAGRALSRARLEQIVAENDKKRFTISDDGLRIRAAQGHSVAVDLALVPQEPPAVLYHGTARHHLDAIFLADGLLPGKRQQVHMSSDLATARKVGSRHGKPVVLLINAKEAHAAGCVFTRADNGVWLCDHIPAIYLSFASTEAAQSD